MSDLKDTGDSDGTSLDTLDWNRLRSGYLRALNPDNQPLFDAFFGSFERQALASLVSLLLQTMTPIGPMRERKDYPRELQHAIDVLHGRASHIPPEGARKIEPKCKCEAAGYHDPACRRGGCQEPYPIASPQRYETKEKP